MHLYAISYTNIGPFPNQTITVCFKHGKYLITAPIGTGKSFLFFDGPVYALYKYATRNLLSTGAKTGSLTLHFSIDNTHYLIKRTLTKGKKQNSCKSRLWKMEEKKTAKTESSLSQSYFDTIITLGETIEKTLQKYYDLEEIAFKNETDLQATLEQMLPPREVFLATHILMQDAENIFTQQPSERLEVFKHIFNLLGIDSGKEILTEKKRELQAKIIVLGDTSQADKKLHELLAKIKEQVEFLLEVAQQTKGVINFDIYSQEFDDLRKMLDERTMFGNKLTITSFETTLDPSPLLDLLIKIQQEQQKIQELSSKVSQKQDLINQYLLNLQTLQDEYNALTKQSEELEELVKASPVDLITAKKQERENIIQQQQQLWGEIPQNVREMLIMKKGDKQSISSNILLDLKETISSRYELCQEVIAEGKTINSEIEANEAHIKSFLKTKEILKQQRDDLDYSNEQSSAKKDLLQEIASKKEERKKEIDRLQREVSKEDELYEQRKQQLTQKHEHLLRLAAKMQEETHFHCDKINGSCPYTKIINKKTLDEISNQYNILQHEIAELEKKLKEDNRQERKVQLLATVSELEKCMQDVDHNPEAYLLDFFKTLEEKRKKMMRKYEIENIDDQLKQLEEKKKNLTQKREELRAQLQQLNYKTCETVYKKWQELEKQRFLLEQEVDKYVAKLSEIEKSKELLATLQGKREVLQQEIKNVIAKKEKEEQDMKELMAIVNAFPTGNLNNQELCLTTLLRLYEQLAQLIEEQKNKQIAIKKTREQYEIVANLYNIFNKELLLLVLQESVPILQDIINAYLNQVVGYTIAMKVTQENEKINLDISINDAYGERDVRSLSGGQKVILKIVRMLAVSSYLHTSMLFLDETINNLDYEAVGKVADMLTDFVRQHNIKLYVVTHNEQIKEMGIWDEVVQLDVTLEKIKNMNFKN